MLGAARPREARADRVPAGRADEGRDARRGRRRRARCRRAPREPGGVLPRRRRLPLVPRTAWSRPLGRRDRRRNGRELGRHDGVWRYTPGQRRGIGVAAAEPLYALRTDRGPNTLVVGPRGSLARTDVDVAGVLHVPGRPRRGQAPLPLGSDPRTCPAAARWIRTRADEPSYGVAPGQLAVLYDEEAPLSAAVWCRPRRDLGSRRATPCRQRWRHRELALAAFLVAVGAALAYMFVRLGGTFARLSSFIKGTETECCPSSTKSVRASTR